eukprot:TRINITY_DN425_c0_g1_i3.p1 TRINITY_DN425_c0_g1~~TRINITY_DN425_c0_g1_i3.p1  ORF type:complete len:227 (-),score=47.59 TRINITY_DN425_c0_g1_i3:125-805(-)
MAGNPSDHPPPFPHGPPQQGALPPQHIMYVVQPQPTSYNAGAPLLAHHHHQHQQQVVYIPQGYNPQQHYGALGVLAPPQNYVVYNTCNTRQRGPYFNAATTAFVLYLVGMLCFPPLLIVSIAISLHLVRKGIICADRRGAVIAFSILELISWMFVGSFSWFFTSHKITYCAAYSGYNCLYYQTRYTTMWWGWISLVVMYAFALFFGIPRTVFTYKARYNQPEAVEH